MRKERGLSLLEIVVAVAIMATILLFLSRGFVTSMFMTSQTNEYAAAARAAREKMEEITSLTFRRYDRSQSGSTYSLQADPKNTGQYLTTLTSVPFEELPQQLRVEVVGGPLGASPGTPATGIHAKAPDTSGYNFPYGRLHPFKVFLSDLEPDNLQSIKGLLPGLVDDYAGEVVIINSEKNENFSTGTSSVIDPSSWDQTHGVGTYGADLNGDGTPDGFRFFTLPMDLDGDGLFTRDSTFIQNLKPSPYRYAIGVIIRWQGRLGQERYETWSVISAY